MGVVNPVTNHTYPTICPAVISALGSSYNQRSESRPTETFIIDINEVIMSARKTDIYQNKGPNFIKSLKSNAERQKLID